MCFPKLFYLSFSLDFLRFALTEKNYFFVQKILFCLLNPIFILNHLFLLCKFFLLFLILFYPISNINRFLNKSIPHHSFHPNQQTLLKNSLFNKIFHSNLKLLSNFLLKNSSNFLIINFLTKP
jgi:hypothetical protein